jgi:uncharacterized membrane protein
LKTNRIYFVFLAIAAVILFAFLLNTLLPGSIWPQLPGGDGQASLGFGSDAVKGEIKEILDQGQVQLGDVQQEYQVLSVEILEGDLQGVELTVEYGKQQIRPAGLYLKPGDRVFLNISKDQDNTLRTRFLDFERTGPLLALFCTFVLFSVLISGWKGVRGLLGMGISIGVIILYIIPQILDGKDPVLISVSGAFFLLAATLYLVYGWTLKTHAAVLGTLCSLILTAVLAHYFVNLTRLTGFGNEDALFLVQQSSGGINMQGLVLGGMLIGALGVLDDLVITQASVVFELWSLDPDLALKDLFQRSMRVGQDHVAATVNTLVLAYAGAALPMFLLFSIAGTQISYLLNLEFVAEEVVRTMVGSLGLIAAVPLTTFLASLVAIKSAAGGPGWKFLGPPTSGDSHHAH